MPVRAICLLALLLCASWTRAATGAAVPALAAFDTEMQAFMARWQIPGAALAVARGGRLVLARGYGVADHSTGEPVQPDSLFRIASVSKSVTAAAVMQLVERGLISLDTAVFPYLARGTPVDARLNRITVRHLLQHSGGWDRTLTFDPVANALPVASDMGVPAPPDTATLVRWLLGQPLQFDPGTREAYSNIGYVLLGEVIAKASGQRYEDQVRTMLLATGITRMRLGASLPAGRLAGEVVYHMPVGTPPGRSQFASLPGPVPAPYGGVPIELAGAAGGWVASAIDLVAFGAAVDGQTQRADLMSAASLGESLRRPGYVGAAATVWDGLGWTVLASGSRRKEGSAPGTTALLVVRGNGTTWAALLNMRSTSDGDAMSADLDGALARAHGSVTTWPTGDAFPSLHGPAPIDGCFGRPGFDAGRLCLPVVDVPGLGRYTATLNLTDAASFTFDLVTAMPALGSSGDPATFDAVRGQLTVPTVLLSSPGAAPTAYRATLVQVPGPGLRLRLLDAAPR